MNTLAVILSGEGESVFITLCKIGVAFILGGIIGLERESKGKPVGFKTCVIISVASCVLTIVSIQSAEYYAEISANIRSDPMRLAAQIISGVGFLGAGVILHRHDDAISGLTTAAIVWASAGVGITSGAGFICMLFSPPDYFCWRSSSAIASFFYKLKISHPVK